jgi:hypothetical protein
VSAHPLSPADIVLTSMQKPRHPLAISDIPHAGAFHGCQKSSRHVSGGRITISFGFEAFNEPLLPLDAPVEGRKAALVIREHFAKPIRANWAFRHVGVWVRRVSGDARHGACRPYRSTGRQYDR